MHVPSPLAALTLLATFAAVEPALADDAKGVAITKAWARATPGGATVGAAYAEIANAGSDVDKLIAVASTASERVEIHTHAMDEGVMRMRRLDFIAIPPGATAVLAPGGDHIMLMDLKSPLKAGERIGLTFTFEKAGPIEVSAEIAAIGAAAPPSADAGSQDGQRAGGEVHDGSHEGSHEGSHDGSHDGSGGKN